ncbi:MAG TPA: hypothetical protein PKD53_32010 [Chloroflexaceae bacterium]|nr:hypothetical protein [Chloroflexaceae bacterium]
MLDYQDESVKRVAPRRPEAPAGDGALLERAVGDARPLPVSAEPSLLRPQQHRNAVWRWHVRRRPRRP